MQNNFILGASNGGNENIIGINHTGNDLPSHLPMHHHNSNIHPHSATLSQASHVHSGHHIHGHGLISIGNSGGGLADIHGLDLDSIGKINPGNNNNNNTLTG